MINSLKLQILNMYQNKFKQKFERKFETDYQNSRLIIKLHDSISSRLFNFKLNSNKKKTKKLI